MRRKREVGFISENSAEHLLVHRLHEIISPQVGQFLPLHFSGTREGSSMARSTFGHHLVRCAAVYARRPKVMEPKQTLVVMKINKSLFAAAWEGGRLGCPVIVGLPLINELGRFSLTAPCAWFRLSAESHFGEDLRVTVDLNNETWQQQDYGQDLKPITEAHLFSEVLEGARLRSWDDAVQVMKTVKFAGYGEDRPMFGGYRPFFAICTPKESMP